MEGDNEILNIEEVAEYLTKSKHTSDGNFVLTEEMRTDLINHISSKSENKNKMTIEILREWLSKWNVIFSYIPIVLKPIDRISKALLNSLMKYNII